MQHDQHLEPRNTELEIKASFAEDLQGTLNQTIFRQQQQIDDLAQALAQLRQRMVAASGDATRAAHDELPPHY